MSFFQKSVINKYLKGVTDETIETAWVQFKRHFHNPIIQQNIQKAKEELCKKEFLIDLFVKVLGYTKNPEPNFNLTTELKNVKGAKKADGAILIDKQPIAVIELKGAKTSNLDKVEGQAFGYKNNQPTAVYVIISNFEKLRFYVDNSVEFIEFNLFQLTKERFKLLWICLAKDNIFKGLPKQIKTESLTIEEAITKKLYKDYSTFKNELFQNIVEENPQFDKLTLYKKTQKLLDRLLFIFFAEDRLLLPPNSIRVIVEQWQKLKELDEYRPLYQRYQKYFGYMNTGFKGKQHDIFAYNGGLFAADKVLDNIQINDEILAKHTQKLSDYDFESEVSVNILGHIFEHSLNEIEEITAELEGRKVEAKKTKRKKDGVFYTPKYITKYIVDNTLGKLCATKKEQLELLQIDFSQNFQNKQRRKTKAGKRTKLSVAGEKILNKIETYRRFLLDLTICDPACGSGAFLNQALEFLIAEHRLVDEWQTKLQGGSFVFPNVENAILENNLFGVDINEESVDIAKLSLWLRTAQKGRKLNNLNKNIKCGNSLIGESSVAGDKAFNWQKEFPQIFQPKDKQAFHITWVTHNARTSQRMIDYKVKKGEPYDLELEEEVHIINTINQIIVDDGLNVMAMNICQDHMHILLVCEEAEIPNIVRKLKGKSSQKLKEFHGIDRKDKFTLWAQKYHKKLITSNEQLWNTVKYIEENRIKHGLSTLDKGELQDKGLQPLEYEYAFRTEYKGGFDIVLGNPPYGATLSEIEKKYLESYQVFEYQVNTYSLFYEKGVEILKKNGLLGYITPATFTYQHYFKKLRQFLTTYKTIGISKYFYEVFEDADIGDCVTWITTKQANAKAPILLQKCQNSEEAMKLPILTDYHQLVSSSGTYNLGITKIDLEKIRRNTKALAEIAQIIVGIKPYQRGKGKPKQTAEIVKGKIFTATKKENETYINCVIGKDFHRYRFLQSPKMYLSYGKWLAEPRASAPFFDEEKIILRQTADRLIGTIDFEKRINLNNVYNVGKKDVAFSLKYILAILNSQLMNVVYQSISQEKGRVFAEVKKVYLANLPIKIVDKKYQKAIEIKVDEMMKLCAVLQNVKVQFINLLLGKFTIKKLSTKIRNWEELDFRQFLQELKKAKIKLTLVEQEEWMTFFNEKKKKALSIKTSIEQINKEIDQMVYQLYGLTEEEIAIVEGG